MESLVWILLGALKVLVAVLLPSTGALISSAEKQEKEREREREANGTWEKHAVY
jgi:hypothetical protein